jgi:hypothetical protein
MFPQFYNLSLLIFSYYKIVSANGRKLTAGIHDMPHQQIWHYTCSNDFAYLVTVNYVLLYTMTQTNKGYKFNDIWCILLFQFGDHLHGLARIQSRGLLQYVLLA